MGDQYFQQQPEQLKQFLEFIDEDIENVKRVLDFCEQENLDVEFKIHSKSETAEESAQNTDINLNQIVKTLVFKTDDEFIAVLCPGDKRVSEEKLEELTGGKVDMAKPSEVREVTGYIVGGVSPFDLDIPVYMERSLLELDKIKPAGGSRVVAIELDPSELSDIIVTELVSLTET